MMGDRQYRRVDVYVPEEAASRPLWWIPLDAMAGVTWLALSAFTGGVFFGVVFLAWLFHQPRASAMMHQMGWGVIALALALVVVVVVMAATAS